MSQSQSRESPSLDPMATKPALTNEAVALTEKKMDMTLDDIIKMSKKPSSKASRVPSRASNKRRQFPSNSSSLGVSSKVQRYMDSRSSIRQGLLAQKRSTFQGNQFPLAREVARKAAVAPIRNWPVNRPNRVVKQNNRRASAPRNAPANRFVERVKVVSKQRPQTLDALFANMKEQRMRQQQQVMGHGKKAGRQLQVSNQHWQGRRGSAAANGTGS